MLSNRARLLRSAGLAAVLAGFAAAFLGCYEGMPPTFVIRPGGDPPSYLPPDVQLGSKPDPGQVYYYDQARFTEYKNEGGRNQIPPTTEERFIKRGSVLGIIGANTAQVARPDTTDPILAQVYDNPALFGFEPATDRAPGFYDGAIVTDATAFMPPCMAAGSCGLTAWAYNHVQSTWSRKDSIAATTVSPSDESTAWVIRSLNILTQSVLEPTHQPSLYESEWWWSVIPGRGLSVHGMTLAAERLECEVPNEFGGCLVPVERNPARQRNPTFFWVTEGALKGYAINKTCLLDQDIDGYFGYLYPAPLQLTGADLQVGDRFVTWTYMVPEQFGVCFEENIGLVNIYAYLLLRYEVAVERFYDVLQWRSGNTVVGEYGAPDGIVDVVKLVIRVWLAAPEEIQAQQVDVYLMRGIGIVVQQTGLEVFDVSRLREAWIDGQYLPPSTFKYID